MRCFKYSFCNSVYSRCLKSFSGFANILLQIPVKMGNKVKKVLSPLYSLQIIFLWSSKILYCVCLVCFLSPFFFFFFLHMVIFTTLFQLCPTLWKLTLKMTMLFWRYGIDNVDSTLIWRCATSRRHINLKTTLKQH